MVYIDFQGFSCLDENSEVFNQEGNRVDISSIEENTLVDMLTSGELYVKLESTFHHPKFTLGDFEYGIY